MQFAHRLANQLAVKFRGSSVSSPKNELLWTIIGAILTIAGTFIPAFTINVPWAWREQGIQICSLEVTWQIGAVLLTACLGGKRAGALSQIIYLALGLFYWPVFSQGGGLDYVLEPSFGYLVGFIPGAWYCGRLAFAQPRQLEWLALSGLAGLGIIHGMGVIYLVGLHVVNQIVNHELNSSVALIMTYSWEILPAQLVLVCAVSVLAYGLRAILFY